MGQKYDAFALRKCRLALLNMHIATAKSMKSLKYCCSGLMLNDEFYEYFNYKMKLERIELNSVFAYSSNLQCLLNQRHH